MLNRLFPSGFVSMMTVVAATQSIQAVTVNWAGHTWNVTTGGMAGENTGSAANVVVDANGYLHLKISQINGKWMCAELFTTDKIGFGTYQWQVDGPVDKLDKNIVFGLFPYGPEAGIGADGTNEIDIEYARWGNAAWDNGNFTVYPNSGTTVGETTFNFSMSGTYTTSTFVWSSTSVQFKSQEGFKEIGDNAGLIKSWTYAPTNPSVNIPQRAMPLGMNLWLCSDCGGAPSDGKSAEIVIRKFVHQDPNSGVQAGNPSKGRGLELRTVQAGQLTRFDLSSPATVDLVFTISDLAGRLESTVSVPAGSNGFSAMDLSEGPHVVRSVTMGTSRNIVVFR
ncbi:MAG: glycoside hydrolase family 16 protein [Fibrobacterota bacterium]|nr:glycoside hydrolase family 16 protein [Fibrobacterota bacterium]QQS03303.1 MAG: glycoside hydrolase family 16 protein [Fibrobacterota bacterium]